MFVAVNILCYWLALGTAFPQYAFGWDWFHYFKMQLPVGLLGGLFDCLSFYITLWLVRRAVASKSVRRFIGHLGLDFGVGLAATAWVLFVFVVSGWLVNLIEGRTYSQSGETISISQVTPSTGDEQETQKYLEPIENLEVRQQVYRERVRASLRSPLRNWRNIYFGVIMGCSAMIPTCLHLALFVSALWSCCRGRATHEQRRHERRGSCRHLTFGS